jgi:hypothetical protein
MAHRSPGLTGRVFTWRRWEIYAVLAAVVAIVVVFIGGPVWLNFRLGREVDRFETPPGMQLAERHTVGDFFCVITCLGKSTELTFRTNSDAATACRVLLRHLRAHGYDPETPPLGVVVRDDNPCFYWTRAGRIRKKATMTATVLPHEQPAVVVRFDANNG